MITINWSPQRNDKGQTELKWFNPILFINGIEYDLSEIPDGATIEHDTIFKAERISDDYEITIILNHGSNAPETTRFPITAEITENGNIDVPLYNIVEEPIVEEPIEQLINEVSNV